MKICLNQKSLQKKIFGLIFFWLIVLTVNKQTPACSWDYLIWENRSKNADPYYRFIKDGKAGFINQSGKIVIEPVLGAYGNYQEGIINGLLRVEFEKYIDAKTGREVSSEFYYQNTEVFDGLCVKRFEDKFGFTDNQDKTIIEPEFIYAKNFSEGFAPVILEGPCFYYNPESPCPQADKFPLGTPSQPTNACKFNFINKAGKLISARTFLDVKDFSEGLAPVKTAEGWGYINNNGKIVIAPQFQEAQSFSEGLAMVKFDNLYGYINLSGAFVIAAQFEMAGSFSSELAFVGEYNDKTIDNKFYYINKNGKPATPDKFLLAGSYFRGIAHVLVAETLYVEKTNEEKSEIRKRTYAYINIKGKKIFSYVVKEEM